ncbi:response regulator [Bradyrhizobium sp. OAE829]|uniref:response regulator transcription factor n=1 Tax=Bradyrhizobium sp. OAE829 TaxID=2663807 RepID=UPI00178BDBD7
MPGVVHIVDDDASFRVAVERQLKYAGYEVRAYSSAEEFLDRLPNEAVASCILLDARLSGLSGLELQSRLHELRSTLPVIFLTGFTDIALTVKAVKAGAHDFLTKPVSSEELVQAIERAMAYHQLTYDLKSKLDIIRHRVALLTPREQQVLLLIIRGKINKQIAQMLGCTERTVKAHRQRVMEKMQVHTVAELVSLAERIGLGSATGQTT